MMGGLPAVPAGAAVWAAAPGHTGGCASPPCGSPGRPQLELGRGRKATGGAGRMLFCVPHSFFTPGRSVTTCSHACFMPAEATLMGAVGGWGGGVGVSEGLMLSLFMGVHDSG